MIRHALPYPSETPIEEPCGYEFTIAESQATERAAAEKAKRAATEYKLRLEQHRKRERERAAEFSRQQALREQTEAREKERRTRLEPVERLVWVVFWVFLGLVSGAAAAVCFSTNGSLALLGASIAPCAFALFRLLIVGFDPQLKLWEDLYVTFVYGVLGMITGFLIQLFS